jgi:2-amino-4-hydroxy-6-hydroxymethyldihydropteridine diphosphokinase
VTSGERVFVGLGANLGDAQATLKDALEQIGLTPQINIIAVSPFYSSAPVDAVGPDFVNAVAELRTSLSPQQLLHVLQSIEQRHHRQRPYRNAPRTLDLDLLLHGQQVLQEPTLSVPHPRLHERAFVLRPLLDLAPDLSHPSLGALAQYLPGVAHQTIKPLP